MNSSFVNQLSPADLELLAKVITMKVKLVDSKPQIWRRVVVPAIMPLGALHDVIQIAMGWENCHLHCFEINGEQFSLHYDDDPEPIGIDAGDIALLELGTTEPGFRFEYEYDFGDSWMHEVVVESVKGMLVDKFYPYCEKAVRACPPEDCGGVRRYSQLLRILKNPKHREYEELVEWLGTDEFEPNVVDVTAINEEMQRWFST